MDFETFKSNVEAWAEARNIYKYSTPLAQALKAVSEAGELADNAIKGNIEGMKDDIGDIAVCLVNVARMAGTEIDITHENSDQLPEHFHAATAVVCSLTGVVAMNSDGDGENSDGWIDICVCALKQLATKLGLTFEECCAQAWNDIKDRRGHMVPGGAFVKEDA